MRDRNFKLAAIQAEPVFFNRRASTEKACRLIKEAGAMGADIAGFSETWLPGYPFFIWGASADPSLLWKASAEYLANAVQIPGPETDQLCEAAKKAGIDVAIGVVELDEFTKGTAYCTLLFIGKEGKILGKHRKLKPTHRERTVWGEGDATGLSVHERPYGRISGLNCWEHNMVLPGYVLMSQGTHIHIAAWPGSEGKAPPAPSPMWERQLLLSRAFASQSAAYVILVGGLLNPQNIPAPYDELAVKYRGDSFIIDPRGEIIAGPAKGETILIAEGSMEQVLAAKSAFDVAGHYSRPDVFQLCVNRKPYRRVRETSEQDQPASERESES
uniref:Nitrilase n=1 Tax=uncultured organism TaxID=155900 RepID=Q6RWQ2_9ZZZZ|nr:nitrilase [uncultured organism]